MEFWAELYLGRVRSFLFLFCFFVCATHMTKNYKLDSVEVGAKRKAAKLTKYPSLQNQTSRGWSLACPGPSFMGGVERKVQRVESDLIQLLL